MNEVAEINPGTWASLFAESPGPNTDPTTGTPEADSLNVSGSGPRSTDIEPGADPKTKEETLKVMGNPEAELGTDVLASGPQDLLEEDSPLAKAKVEVKSKTEERKPEVVREAESLDEASDSHSVTEGTPSLPDSKEESVEALEHKPHHATEDSIEGNPSIPSPGASQSSALNEAKTADKADCENPPLTEGEEAKVGKKQNYIICSIG